MAHFGSGDWNNPSGLVAQLSKTSLSVISAGGTHNGAVEGSSLLTYVTKRAGLYRLSGYLRVRTASDGGTHTGAMHATYNNGSAIAQATIGVSGLTPGTLDLKGAAGTNLRQESVVFAASGTTITMLLQDIVGASDAAAGAVDLFFIIEAL